MTYICKVFVFCWCDDKHASSGQQITCPKTRIHSPRGAKAAISRTVSTMKCPASDFIPEQHCREVWQAEWDGCSAYNKLHSVKPHLGYCSVRHLSHYDAVILRRLRIGHTRVIHGYLLTCDNQPLCNDCKCSLLLYLFQYIQLEWHCSLIVLMCH